MGACDAVTVCVTVTVLLCVTMGNSGFWCIAFVSLRISTVQELERLVRDKAKLGEATAGTRLLRCSLALPGRPSDACLLVQT